MAKKHSGQPNQIAGSIFATTFLISVSFFAFSLIGLTSKSAPVGIAVAVGVIALLVILYLLRHVQIDGLNHRWGWLVKEKKRASREFVLRATSKPQRQEFGDRLPPSLNDIRDAKLSSKTWVPNRDRRPQ